MEAERREERNTKPGMRICSALVRHAQRVKRV